MNRLEQLCIQYLESCIGIRNVLVALQNAAKLGLDFVRVSALHFVGTFPVLKCTIIFFTNSSIGSDTDL